MAFGTKYPRDVIEHGTAVMFRGATTDSGFALWTLPLDGTGEPRRIVDAWDGDVSADGRWLAYASNDTPRQVYVTDFPGARERFRISTSGGQAPKWRRDGRELYYVSDDQMLMAVPVASGEPLTVGTPVPLFRGSFDADSQFGSAYAAAADGRRFLVNETLEPADVRLVVTLEWAAGPQ